MAANRRYVNQLMAGETLDQVFLVRDKDLRTTKAGGLYLQCTLADKGGTLAARMWQISESIYNAVPVDGFLQVKGRTEEYRGTLQLIIDACRPWPAEKVDLADFLPVTKQDVEAMWGELTEILRGIKNDPIRLLIKKFIEDQDFVAAFKRSPAALQLHHAFIGGLLEHTLATMRVAKALLPLYPAVNPDLVLAGMFLHDIGKTAELTAGTSMAYTDRGQLVGHVTLAAVWVAQKAAAVAAETGEPFPAKTLDLLQHIIVSHHGQLEFGAPRLPAIPEAFFVHYVDNLDAKLFITTKAIESDPDPNTSFTSYLPSLETRIYKRSKEL
ncbi:MAG: HD domain-containing protein [Phycisphaerae bacterium]|jgi:3'-5' exoribonuclease